MDAPHHVVILGAGYAGVTATNRLLRSLSRSERTMVTVTVVNPRVELVQRIRLHEFAAGSRPSATVALAQVLHREARVLVGEVHAIDRSRRRVRGSGPDGPFALPYDTLVYAVGSGSVAPTGVAGADGQVRRVTSLDEATALRADLTALPPGRTVLVVGTGLTGVETATEIAEQRPDLQVRLVGTAPVGGDLSDAGSRRVAIALGQLGVRTSIGLVVRFADGVAELDDGTGLPFDICVWAGHFAVPDLARESGFSTDPGGRLLVDASLVALDDPAVVGAGDAVLVDPASAPHLRMSCAMAIPMGAHVSAVVLARWRGMPTPPFAAGFQLRCVSLGRRRGLVQFVHPDDAPRAAAFGERAAATVKELICRYTVLGLRAERRMRFVAMPPAPQPGQLTVTR